MSGANLHVGPKLAQPPPALEKPLLLCPDEAGPPLPFADSLRRALIVKGDAE